MSRLDLPLSVSQWKRAREIFDFAMESPPEQRLPMALAMCDGDIRLESELRNLLWAHEENGSFLNEPAIEVYGFSAELESQSLEPGTVLADRFKLGPLLDTGGMGSVYTAWDAELQEEVALKMIRSELARESEILERFKEEVKQARRIAHPSVCRVYDLFCHQDGSGTRIWFLTMQLLPGRTLLHEIRNSGPIARRRAFKYIEDLVHGLAAAHELGIIHRDLKSANIMLVPMSGGAERAVIMDFGLAIRALEVGGSTSGNVGQGTPAYVSPEQWHEGKFSPASDQYSLGVVICEMLTGERPSPPSMRAEGWKPARLPQSRKLDSRLQRVVGRCLDTDPSKRFPSVTSILPALGIGRRKTLLLALSAAALLTAALALAMSGGRDRRSAVRDLKQSTPGLEFSVAPSISKDGTLMAYTSDHGRGEGTDILMKRLPDGPVVPITTDGAGNDVPSISPDGSLVAFRSTRSPAGIYIASYPAGTERLLAKGGKNPQFSPDGKHIAYWIGDETDLSMSSGRIYVLDIASNTSTQLAPRFSDARTPIWNSDGHHILFRGCPLSEVSLPSCWDWWITTADGAEPVATGARARLDAKRLSVMGNMGGWFGEHVLFNAASGREIHLWTIPISTGKGRVSGEPEELDPGDERESVYTSTLSENGVLAITNLFMNIHIWRIDVSNSSLRGSLSQVTEDANIDLDPSVSSDGERLIFVRGRTASRDIWIKNLRSGEERRISADGIDKYSPVIDDSGHTIAYETWNSGASSIRILSQPSNQSRTICSDCRTPTGWFGGDRGLLFSDVSISRIDAYNSADGTRTTILAKPGAHVSQATRSPANQMLLFAVTSDKLPGQVFAAPFPSVAPIPESRWIPVTAPSDLAKDPRWSADGNTVFYLSDRDGHLCVWGQHFDQRRARPVGGAFKVHDFHAQNFSLSRLSSRSFNMSTGGKFVYLNIPGMSGTILTGKLEWPKRKFPEIFAPF